jgi:hypothetical protein
MFANRKATRYLDRILVDNNRGSFLVSIAGTGRAVVEGYQQQNSTRVQTRFGQVLATVEFMTLGAM